MYYYIKGILALKGENFAVVDAGGVGYKIFTSANVLATLGAPGSTIQLFTHLHIKEDAHDLFGFPTNEELGLFLQLLSVSGVGPKAALAILSVNTPERFALAVLTGDKKAITPAAGVGPKLAERIILELKDKMKGMDSLPSGVSEVDFDAGAVSEAISALSVLGYSHEEAARAVSDLDESLPLEDLVREALKKLMK